tara:strand:- start:13086 stop:14216 length:1131 start_codon:yes stop_codon:yes gene_type:complete
MPLFAAVSPYGLRDFVEEELIALDVKVVKKEERAIYFQSNWLKAYEYNYTSRFASRVLYSFLDFAAYNEEDLYFNTKKHDFAKYIGCDQTFKVDAKVFHGTTFRDQRFVALKVKDAIADQFKEKFSSRPNVDTENPDMSVHVRVYKNQISLSLDLSGKALHERSYKKRLGEAPLKENLAASLLRFANWSPEQPLVDPMCGGGTILIEAARWAAQIPAGHLRDFAFQRWKNYQQPEWEKRKAEIDANINTDVELSLWGADISGQVLENAKQNAKRAGVAELIHWQVQDVEKMDLPHSNATIISNPPYAKRIGDKSELKALYKNLAAALKAKGTWDLWLLSGDAELSKELRLKAKQKIPLKNGNIDCRLLNYPVNQPS